MDGRSGSVCSASSVLADQIFGPIQGVDLESGASALSNEHEARSLVSPDLHIVGSTEPHIEFVVGPYEREQVTPLLMWKLDVSHVDCHFNSCHSFCI